MNLWIHKLGDVVKSYKFALLFIAKVSTIFVRVRVFLRIVMLESVVILIVLC